MEQRSLFKDASPASPWTANGRGEQDTSIGPSIQLENKLNFQYRGDVFSQHGVYSDANLYLSRLPSSRKGSILRPKVGTAYRMQGVKLAPMQREPSPLPSPAHPSTGGSKPNKTNRKRQYALTLEAMATNSVLRDSLLANNVIPNILSLTRTKDTTTLASCIATLAFLSSDALGRKAILKTSALPLLASISTCFTPQLVGDSISRQTLLHNYLGLLANLTIEDAFEGAFVREKALDSMLQHRKVTLLSERMCMVAILNLSCPTYSYPRVDDVIHAIYECGRGPPLSPEYREMVSCALYNLSCIRANQIKLIDGDVVGTLCALIVSVELDPGRNAVVNSRTNALMTAWHLAENHQCRRALARSDCIHSLTQTLRNCQVLDNNLKCVLLVLLTLAADDVARQRLGKAGIFEILEWHISQFQHLPEIHQCSDSAKVLAVMYRLIALVLSSPITVEDVTPQFLSFLLDYRHENSQLSSECSRYVLYSLVCILSWSDSAEGDHIRHGRSTVGLTTSVIQMERSRPHIDDVLEDPFYLDPLLAHVGFVKFPHGDAPEVFLQVLLLYNLSFRYNKLDVARRASTQLKSLIQSTSSDAVLSLLCGTLFSLCQEYEVHKELHQSGVLHALPLLLERCRKEPTTQIISLDVVCIIFDGRMLARSDLVELMLLVAPALVILCETGSTALRASCAACFARFASVEECCPAMAQHGVIRALAVLANEEDSRTLRLCVSAYSCLSRDTSSCAQLISSGIIKSLTFLAAAPEEAVRRACAMTLCNLSTVEENVGALAKAGALKALLVISCVKSNDPETRRICMKAVMNLLRLPSNIPLLCQDGLVWAFGLFTSTMEPKDFDILCDAFCALAFFSATRKGIAKPTILTAMFQVFESPSASVASKARLLKGVSNLLCDLPNATPLIHAGIMPHLIKIALPGSVYSCTDGEARMLVAQILVLIFQSCPDVECEFLEPSMIRAIGTLLNTNHDECVRCCTILLFQMSQHTATRASLVVTNDASVPSIMSGLAQLFDRSPRDTQSLLIRLLYNISCDAHLNRILDAKVIVSCIGSTLPRKIAALTIETAAFCAGLFRNLSCEAPSHEFLMEEQATKLLQMLFDVDNEACKEDVAVSMSNLFMGRVNTSALLARGALPVVLWLCSTRASLESRVLGTTVVRKLSISPGNAEALVDGGVISHLALLMQDCESLVVKTNCIATFCGVSRKSGVPALLASYGVISSVLELLHSEGSSNHLFESMCVDLLSALAEFARADDPNETRLASTLYQLIERDEGSSSTTSSSLWQTDRSFLERNARSSLSHPTPSCAHDRVMAKPPTLRHTLYPVRFAGNSVDFTQVTSSIDLRTVEPIFPPLSAIGEDLTEAAGVEVRPLSMPAAPPSRFEFASPPMFPKHCEPFPATASSSRASF